MSIPNLIPKYMSVGVNIFLKQLFLQINCSLQVPDQEVVIEYTRNLPSSLMTLTLVHSSTGQEIKKIPTNSLGTKAAKAALPRENDYCTIDFMIYDCMSVNLQQKQKCLGYCCSFIGQNARIYCNCSFAELLKMLVCY